MNPGKTLADFVSQINGDGSIEEIHSEVTQAVKEFTQHMASHRVRTSYSSLSVQASRSTSIYENRSYISQPIPEYEPLL